VGSRDRVHLPFILVGLGAALLVGFVLGAAIPLLEHGAFRLSGPGVEGAIQAHGAAQLSGWAGLLVVGMGLRLLPRFAGRPPIVPAVAGLLWVLMVLGLVLRLAGQLGGSSALLPVGLSLQAVGRIGFVAAVGVIITTAAPPRRSWMIAVVAGMVGWLAWAAADLVAATTASQGLIPEGIESASTYLALFTAVGPFIWAVQSRSVPTFFGRTDPATKRLLAPCAGLIAAAALLLWTGTFPSQPGGVLWWGAVVAGLSTAAIAPLAGGLAGDPARLRQASRPLAAYVIAANRWAMAAGGLLFAAGVVGLSGGSALALGLADAARHAFGIGTVSLLIVGMAELLTPEFAMARMAGSGSPARMAPFWLLNTAAAVRIIVDLPPLASSPSITGVLVGTAGVLGWVGLAVFGLLLFRTLATQPGHAINV
jgi:hypothetical protein